MRIAHVIASMDPVRGGPIAVVARLAAAQARLGDQVTIYSGTHADAAAASARNLSGIPGIELVHRTEVPPVGGVRQIALNLNPNAAALRRLCAESDILHLHGIWEPFIWSAADAAVAADTPYVLMLHGMLDPWSLAQKRLKKRVAMTLRVASLLGKAAFLHALTEAEAAAARANHAEARIRIIPNGVFLEELSPLPARDAFVLKHPALQGRRYALFMGRLHLVKGLDYLADAFAHAAPRLSDVDLVIAGPDDGEKADFERRIAEHGLTERVHIIGPIYGGAKIEALVGASCFVQPSRQEAFSMSILEALACGVPAVVTSTCRFPAVETEGAGRVVALDAVAVGEGLVDVLSDESRRVRMGEAGRAFVHANFTWPRIAEQLRAYYQESIPQRV